MNYLLDITDSYSRFIDFDGLSGIMGYSSFPIFNKADFTHCYMILENIAINMDEDIWREPIISVNSKSIINSENNSIFMLLLKKSILHIEKIKSYDLRVINNNHWYYHSSGLNFQKHDYHICGGGYDLEHINTNIYYNFNFAGKVFLEFNEKDIVIQAVGYEDRIGSYKDIEKINRDKKAEIESKNNLLCCEQFNNIESPIWDFDFLIEYFSHEDGYWEAIKSYNETDK